MVREILRMGDPRLLRVAERVWREERGEPGAPRDVEHQTWFLQRLARAYRHLRETEPAVVDRKGRVIQPARTEWRDKPGAKPFGIYRKSDAMLMFWLRGWRPQRYRPAAHVEVSGPDGGAIEIVERLNAGRERARRLALVDRERVDRANDARGD